MRITLGVISALLVFLIGFQPALAAQEPVDGVCGSAQDVAVSAAPTTGLCSAGTASAVTGAGPWHWRCKGSHGGSTDLCSAPVLKPDFEVSVAASPAGVAAGQTETIAAGATANMAASAYNMVFTVTLNGSQVASHRIDGLDFTAGAAVSESWAWKVPARAAAGTYTVTAAVKKGGVSYGSGTASFAVNGKTPASASGTTIPPAAQIVDANGNVYTVSGGQIYRNGVVDPVTAGVTLLLYYKGAIYQYAYGIWYELTGSSWPAGGSGWTSLRGGPEPASASGTTIPPAAQIVDANGNVYTVSGGQIYRNGVVDPVTAGVTLLLYYKGAIYQEAYGIWYELTGSSWPAGSSGWTSIPGDPRGAAAPVNGACGAANGTTVGSAPAANLCSAGTASSVSVSGPWDWSCAGSNGGATAQCSAQLAQAPINGQCGSSNGTTVSSAPTTNLCSAGTASSISGAGPWDWTCTGVNGGTTAQCSANETAVAVNGVCGAANGTTVSAAPTTNLCSTGTASSVSGSGPWDWTCAGSNGGTAAQCSANETPAPVNGVCGAANGATTNTAPSGGNLCSAGTASAVTGTGPWSWSCAGSNGGATAQCSAQAPAATVSPDGSVLTPTSGGSLVTAAGTWTFGTGPDAYGDYQILLNGSEVGLGLYLEVDNGGQMYMADVAGPSDWWVWQNDTWVSTSDPNGTPVNGACGSANGATVSTAPTTNLCSTGTASAVTGTGPWDWSCAGSNGGTTAQCSASLAQSPPVNGACGSANGTTVSSAPTANLCSTGTASAVSGSGPWDWSCAGSNGGTTAQCSAQPASTLVNGACGSANGATESAAPSGSALCSAGTASSITDESGDGAGPWDWTCAGLNGGSTDSCEAFGNGGGATPVNGVCGAANGATTNAAPSGSSLCSAGTASSVSGSGPWTWSCNGSNGGASASCEALPPQQQGGGGVITLTNGPPNIPYAAAGSCTTSTCTWIQAGVSGEAVSDVYLDMAPMSEGYTGTFTLSGPNASNYSISQDSYTDPYGTVHNYAHITTTSALSAGDDSITVNANGVSQNVTVHKVSGTVVSCPGGSGTDSNLDAASSSAGPSGIIIIPASCTLTISNGVIPSYSNQAFIGAGSTTSVITTNNGVNPGIGYSVGGTPPGVTGDAWMNLEFTGFTSGTAQEPIQMGNGWVLRNSYFYQDGQAVSPEGCPVYVLNNRMIQNTYNGIAAGGVIAVLNPNGCAAGSAYAQYVVGNEWAYNNPGENPTGDDAGQKWISGVSFTLNLYNNYIHDNYEDGFWSDSEQGPPTLNIYQNTFINNGKSGIELENSGQNGGTTQITVNNNFFLHNADGTQPDWCGSGTQCGGPLYQIRMSGSCCINMYNNNFLQAVGPGSNIAEAFVYGGGEGGNSENNVTIHNNTFSFLSSSPANWCCGSGSDLNMFVGSGVNYDGTALYSNAYHFVGGDPSSDQHFSYFTSAANNYGTWTTSTGILGASNDPDTTNSGGVGTTDASAAYEGTGCTHVACSSAGIGAGGVPVGAGSGSGGTGGSATNGACGSATTTYTNVAPTSNLCSAGTASAVEGTGPWSWNCYGSGSGSTDALCQASSAPVNGVCGSANGAPASSAPASNLCSSGTATSVTDESGDGAGPWAWVCTGSDNTIPIGNTVGCETAASSTPSTGLCGSANGTTTNVEPTANLCSTGATASSVTDQSGNGTGPWTWSCTSGSNTSQCEASPPGVITLTNGPPNIPYAAAGSCTTSTCTWIQAGVSGEAVSDVYLDMVPMSEGYTGTFSLSGPDAGNYAIAQDSYTDPYGTVHNYAHITTTSALAAGDDDVTVSANGISQRLTIHKVGGTTSACSESGLNSASSSAGSGGIILIPAGCNISITSSYQPADNNQVFIGAGSAGSGSGGSTITGTNVTPGLGVFPGPTGVAWMNMEVTGFTTGAIGGTDESIQMSDGWVVRNVYNHDNDQGATAYGCPSIILDNRFIHNAYNGLSGGGLSNEHPSGCPSSTPQIVAGNEWANNNTAKNDTGDDAGQKWINSGAFTLNLYDNYIHDNYEDGFWSDSENGGVHLNLYDNTVVANGRGGFELEMSGANGQIEVYNNFFIHNADGTNPAYCTNQVMCGLPLYQVRLSGDANVELHDNNFIQAVGPDGVAPAFLYGGGEGGNAETDVTIHNNTFSFLSTSPATFCCGTASDLTTVVGSGVNYTGSAIYSNAYHFVGGNPSSDQHFSYFTGATNNYGTWTTSAGTLGAANDPDTATSGGAGTTDTSSAYEATGCTHVACSSAGIGPGGVPVGAAAQ